MELHIMDGIAAMEGEGPTAGSVFWANKILISTDPLALDTTAIKMLGLDIKEIPILHAAIERKLGESNKDRIEICGDYNEPPLLQNYKIPKRFTSKKMSNYNAIIKVVDFLKTKPMINMKKCLKCNTCIDSCPMHAIDRATKKIDYSSCIECMCCHELCLHKAIELKSVNPVAGILMKLYRGKYK